MEAIACIGMNHFYSDQPELSLRFYRRLLQMGINNAELFNNLGMCCFYAQQYDMTLACMERALALGANNEELIGKVKIFPSTLLGKAKVQDFVKYFEAFMYFKFLNYLFVETKFRTIVFKMMYFIKVHPSWVSVQ